MRNAVEHQIVKGMAGAVVVGSRPIPRDGVHGGPVRPVWIVLPALLQIQEAADQDVGIE